MIDAQQATAAARLFSPAASMRAIPYGSGHINDTWLITTDEEINAKTRFILQRINTSIFKQPAALMQNIELVTAHLASKLADNLDRDRLSLSLIPTRTGELLYEDGQGDAWRAYRYIANAHTCDTAETPHQAYQAARAFGHFQKLLADLPADQLHVTIPDFHDTPKRFAALLDAIDRDAANRAATASKEIDFALARQPIAGTLFQAQLPSRVTHNDTKFNNVLLDDLTGEALCVIDLDTVMPGLALYDFGDMVRTTTSPAAEDEPELSKVEMLVPMYEALVRGYLSSADFLTAAEKQYLAFSGKLMAFEQGVRFLTDYLSDDTYYKVHRSRHNLDRCRTQFALMQSIEQQQEKMHRLVETLS
jgi:thiamine kinase-like enzyme